ncbi:MAG: hypothetical protein HGN29_16395 [Asgard group archaeon]|nr:hypothetical protein [Asgard group archaeon]
MDKNNLLYITLMILGFLAAGVLLITFSYSVWWIGMVLVFVAVVIALWTLSIYLIPKKAE